MAKIIEADRHIRSAPESDVARYCNEYGMAERIREWLETPEGTMAHHPSWGHNLIPFKHDPLSKDNGIDVLIEMAIARKLPLDIRDIRILGVDVQVTEFDMFNLYIRHQLGDDVIPVKL